MKLFDVLSWHAPDLRPEKTKLHLAAWDGRHDPLHEFFAGRFEEWQAWQGKRNFSRPYIVAVVPLPGTARWLFAGCFRVLGCAWVETPGPPHWSYMTEELGETAALAGRIVVGFKRPGRAAYLDAARWAPDLSILAIQERRQTVGEFPGYDRVRLRKGELDLVVKQGIQSWREALAAVAGVYLITDTETGRLYVGSATGLGGLWARWSQYSADGHGGNADLKALLTERGKDYARHFTFAVLEIADTHAGTDDVLRRESHWKDVLCTRQHGYNKN